MGIDDAVGAVTVHGTIGLFGLVMLGVFVSGNPALDTFMGDAKRPTISLTGQIFCAVLFFLLRSVPGYVVSLIPLKSPFRFIQKAFLPMRPHPFDLEKKEKMNFLYDMGDWLAIFAKGASGVIFTGWGVNASGWYTLILIINCTVVLVMANSSESKKYNEVEK